MTTIDTTDLSPEAFRSTFPPAEACSELLADYEDRETMRRGMQSLAVLMLGWAAAIIGFAVWVVTA